MDKQLEEIEKKFIKASDLLRVKTFVKQLKQENMSADVLHLIATTYTNIEQAKGIAKDIDNLRNKRVLNDADQYQLGMFEDIKSNLLKEIRNATKSLESKTNLMDTKSVALSVIRDLDEATSTFKDLVLSARICELRTLKNKK